MCRLLSLVITLATVWGCDAVTLTAGEGLTLHVSTESPNSLTYSLDVDGQNWLTSGPVVLTSGGTQYTTAPCDKCLTMFGSPRNTTGSDDFGAYVETAVTWTAAEDTIVTAFRVYSDIPVIVFEQRFPSGITTPVSKRATSTSFPSWQMTGDLLAFTGKNQDAIIGKWSEGSFGSGTQGGSPLALYKSVSGTTRGIVQSPLDNFVVASISSPNSNFKDRISGSGVLGTVKSIPKGYIQPTILVGGAGVTGALMDWGDLVLKRGGKTRTVLDHPTDVSLTHIGYWTDNGAWYHYLCSECCAGSGAQNPCPCPPECADGVTMEKVMLEVKADAAKRKIPFQYFMFDSWWYPKAGDPSANSSQPWPVRDGNGMLSWTPEPQVFPSGTSDWLGLPTFLHARYLSPENVYRKLPEFKDDFICEGEQPGPSPGFACKGPSYCEHKGMYCGGDGRVLLRDVPITLESCQKNCTNDPECKCFDFGVKSPTHPGSTCRIYKSASDLAKSHVNLTAYVRPETTAPKPEEGICLPTTAAFYQHMLTGVQGWRPFVYERDWISATFQKSKAVTNSTVTGKQWLTVMNDAVLSLNMTIQYSMSYTPAIMQSSTLQAVTQIRGSGDYECGSTQWQVGKTSMMYWALGAVASKDTFFTTKHQPGCPKAGKYNCTEPNVEVQVIMATLAGGPVGPGDRLGLTNKTITMHSCNEEGRVLRADQPLGLLDKAMLLFPGSERILWSTFSAFDANSTGSGFHYLFTTETDSIEIRPSDLLSPCGSSAIGKQRACKHMGPAAETATYVAAVITETGGAWPGSSQTTHKVSEDTPYLLQAPAAPKGEKGVQSFAYVILAPALGNYVIFGELDKVVPVSANRFGNPETDPEGNLTWKLTGAPSEEVHVSWDFAQSSGHMRTSNCVISSDGSAILKCDHTGCNCSSSL